METANSASANRWRSICLWSVLIGIAFYFSSPYSYYYLDYTLRVAENFLHGKIGFTQIPPPYLNEFVPFDGAYYSVFPLGSVLTMLPFAVLKSAGMIRAMPSAMIAALIAAGGSVFLFLIGNRYEISRKRRVLMVLGMIFGTWAWTNLAFGGAWQFALGFAVLGELGAIYFTAYNRKAFIAGLFFALAFGNRTEILLTAPVFLYLFLRPYDTASGRRGSVADRGSALREAAAFCITPFVLGVLTLVYNYLRFRSFTDFGYARIPGVLDEPWYAFGIFSAYYIPDQAWQMLAKPWYLLDSFPYLVPDGYSSSILISSPFLLFLARFGARDRGLKYASWFAVIILTLLLWTHGNSGGWQFGYRYAMVCLPWIFVLLLESAPKNVPPLELAAYILSFAANAYATWLFHWTDYVKP
jgi:hypothetical protein